MDDFTLIQRYIAGEDDCLNTLLQGHMQKIYSACYRVCLDEHDANDITQNVVLKIIRYLPKFWGRSSLSTWYYRIAYNESITYLKKKRGNIDIDDLSCIPEETQSITQHINAKDISETVTKKIHALPTIDRNIILYYYYDDLKIREIADIMDMNENTIKTKLSRAKKTLSLDLKKYEEYY